MARLVGVRQIWTFVGLYLGAVIGLGAGAAVSMRMMEHQHASTGYRVVAALMGAGGLLPCVVLMTWLYRRSDEFERHAMLVTLAIAFGIAAVGLALLDGLEAAGFLPYGALGPRWWLIPGFWILAVGVVRLAAMRRS